MFWRSEIREKGVLDAMMCYDWRVDGVINYQWYPNTEIFHIPSTFSSALHRNSGSFSYNSAVGSLISFTLPRSQAHHEQGGGADQL